jgi:putative transposase
MLDPSQFQQWCQRLQLPPTTCDLITRLRTAPPARRVQSRAENVSGRYPSRKMGVTIQFESHTVELWAIYTMEHDPQVLEYLDQPLAFKLRYRSASGRQVAVWHTPDFFVLRADGAGWEEWKTEAHLQELVHTQPQRYQHTAAGGWCCPPGEAYAAPLALTYRVRSSHELHPTYIQNLIFLEDYLFDRVVAPDLQARVVEVVRHTPGLTLATLLHEVPSVRPDEVYALVGQEHLYVDLHAAPLTAHRQVCLYLDRAMAEAQRLMATSPTRQAWGGPFGPSPRLLSAERPVLWDGRGWTLVNVGDTLTTLWPDVGPPLQLPTPFVLALLDTGVMTLPPAPDLTPSSVASSDVQRYLTAASPTALATANRRFHCVQAYLHRQREFSQDTPMRTLYRWVARFRHAQATLGCGYVGLLPRTQTQGNRLPKAPEASQTLMETFIREHFEVPTQPHAWAVYLAYQQACAARALLPVSAATFYRRIKQRAGPDQTAKRRGARAAYAETPWYWELTQTTPRHGDRPFAIAHLDHTQLEIELRADNGRLLGRPWASFLVDAYSRRLLAVYLTFDAPSYRSCMMALRICVRQYSRLPQTLVVDGGKEFHSVYFESMLAQYYCTQKTRPGAKPRFGAVVERLFGTAQTQFIHTLLGNTQASKQPRLMTKTVDPKRQAVWTLGDLYDFLCEWAYHVYDQTVHPALGQSPREAFQMGLVLGGEREHRQIPYDDAFVMATRPSTRKGTATVQPGQGIKVHHIYYWHDAFRNPEVERTEVPVRYDPFDIGVAYAFVQHRWVQCLSQYFAQLHGHSEKALLLASAELRQHQPRPTTRITAKHLADFLAKATTHEALLLQRLHDHEAQRVLAAIAGRHSTDTAGTTCSPQLFPATALAGGDAASAAPVDIATLPVFEEYR